MSRAVGSLSLSEEQQILTQCGRVQRKSLQDVQDKYVTLHDLVDADKQVRA